MSSLKLLVVLSSVREPRNADRVCKLVSKLATDKGFVVEILGKNMTPIFEEFWNCFMKEPPKECLEMVKIPLHFYPDPTKAPKQLHILNEKIISADAFLFITAEYNAGVPPALLNMVAHVPPPSFAFKPAGIVSYSTGNGGKLSTSHLLDTLVYLGCMVQPFTVSISTVEKAISEQGEAVETYTVDNTKILLDQLEFTGLALKNQKQSGKMKQPKLNNNF